jgi:hypothetical protein
MIFSPFEEVTLCPRSNHVLTLNSEPYGKIRLDPSSENKRGLLSGKKGKEKLGFTDYQFWRKYG